VGLSGPLIFFSTSFLSRTSPIVSVGIYLMRLAEGWLNITGLWL